VRIIGVPASSGVSGTQKQYMFVGRTISHAIGVSKGLGRVRGPGSVSVGVSVGVSVSVRRAEQ